MEISDSAPEMRPNRHLELCIKGTRIEFPCGLIAGVRERSRKSGLPRRLAKKVGVNVAEDKHGWQWLLTGHGQFESAGVEIELQVRHRSVLIPAMRFAPLRQVKPLFGIRRGKAEEALRHFCIHVAIRLVFLVQEDDGRLAAAGEDVVVDLVVNGPAGAGAIVANDGEYARVVTTADQILRDHSLLAGIDLIPRPLRTRTHFTPRPIFALSRDGRRVASTVALREIYQDRYRKFSLKPIF